MFTYKAPFKLLSSTLTPFLYPCLDSVWSARTSALRNVRCSGRPRKRLHRNNSIRCQSTIAEAVHSPVDVNKYDHLDPSPPDYSSNPFTDSCELTIAAGSGGHGCISFLREKYIANGPPNGGDGGTGGGVYIQAIKGETSLHKLARRGVVKAGRGKNGQGSLQGGSRGEDVLLIVPVGTVVREIWRHDPLAEGDAEGRRNKGFGRDLENDVDDGRPDQSRKWRRDKWLLYPGALPKSFTSAEFPALPRPRRSNLVATEPPGPLRLDLDKPMDHPMLLVAGAMGGLGNPHFVTKSIYKPKYATKGEEGTRIHLQLELKLLADVGLVGLPNAGKSTLLRSLTRSRTRIGDWAFTTLAPNVGTVVLDANTGRPSLDTKGRRKEPRTNFTIADIPGLIEDAHLDRGLGLAFLRHIERAGVLAFVLDLSAGDAVAALKALWREVGEYEKLREQELNADTERRKPDEDGMVTFEPFASSISPGFGPEESGISSEDSNPNVLDPAAGRKLPPLTLPPISSKPWLVVATKADKPDTQENFMALQKYMQAVEQGEEEHPSGKKNAWRLKLHTVPVAAINKEGVGNIPEIILSLLGE
ncbi:GTP1/OBG [Teratosphaeria destructans]|uniref:GTP1/OBG n=1 Tax=Teratosphaeria destructans TaxID=418781 RepID=A0A9W7SXZ3_9PEZI|nr:GTP1/OBG [Teratosphaeria destructans]